MPQSAKPSLALGEAIAPPSGVELPALFRTEAASRVLDVETLGRLERLHRKLEPIRRELLFCRTERQRHWDQGGLPAAPSDAEARAGRDSEWQIAPLPPDLLRRRVEITGPVDDAKMVLNMLSEGADGLMADAAMLDFEDSMRPTWANVLRGHENLLAAVEGTLEYRRPATTSRPAKTYRLDSSRTPTLMVRCRGLHLDEPHVLVDGQPLSAGLFDMALAFLRCGRTLVAQGRTPAFYVPKIESHQEAGWWSSLFRELEVMEGLPTGTLRATFLIETLPAAMQMEEILYRVRLHAAGLNVGRWDKIFSDIRVLMEHPDRVLGDRATLTMDRRWMHGYAQRLINVCHRRGAFAMGGMSALTPGQSGQKREAQRAGVLADKQSEAALGHDGCWVSHPYFIGTALAAFSDDHQLDRIPEAPPLDVLLPEGGGPYTLEGLRENVRVGIAYLEGWERGRGCVAWDDRMEDLATLEISRVQTLQWLRHAVTLQDGRTVDRSLVEEVFAKETESILDPLVATGASSHAIKRFRRAAATAVALYTETPPRPFLSLLEDGRVEIEPVSWGAVSRNIHLDHEERT
ncbi:MAG: malate synthase [Thermoanaerobaculia bacterium]|nr:malate synthase [Thermoanaerobaculia bacterium]